MVNAFAQQAITAVNITNSTAAGSTTYMSTDSTYNWGVSPNNGIQFIDGFTSMGLSYSYASYYPGTVKIRRVDNAKITGNYTLAWSQGTKVGTTYNCNAAYETELQNFFSSRTFNKGTDNFFDNSSANCNNIERMDWIANTGFSTPNPAQVGFAVFERGADNAHDAFKIAAVTAVDAFGNPTAYGTLVSVASSQYGNIASSSVGYNIVKGASTTALLQAGTGTQNRGGVLVSLSTLGISIGQTVFGYSLFSNDLPAAASSANMVAFNNTTNFPIITGTDGGIDLIAVTGVYVETTVLPVRLLNFTAKLIDHSTEIKWSATNEQYVKKYVIERSENGSNFYEVRSAEKKLNTMAENDYMIVDDVNNSGSNVLFYRIKQVNQDLNVEYSKTLSVKKSVAQSSIVIFPNPVSTQFNAQFNSERNQLIQVRLINAAGATVETKSTRVVVGTNSISLKNVTNIAAGNYSIIITDEAGKTHHSRFVKD